VANRKTGTSALIVLVVVVLATIVFIIANSLQSSAGSWNVSNAVAALFEPVLRKIHAVVSKVAPFMGFPVLSFEVFVRKLAHVAEYCLLGAECAGITVLLSGRVLSSHLWACLFVPLAVAVSDEYVQLLSGRTSQVSDVLIDFFSALAGIAIVLLIAVLATNKPQKS
jgi:VanZ family protein